MTIKLLPQSSFPQKAEEVIELLQRKLEKGKLSKMGREFIENQKKQKHDSSFNL